MRCGLIAFFGIVSLLFAGCQLLANDWPDRQNRTPEQMLTDLIQHQQRRNVKVSTGELAHECFTDIDLRTFRSADRPRQIVARLQKAEDFDIVAAELRTLPPERLVKEMLAAKRLARRTWREMGFIDREGRGQTEAGQRAELMIAEAIVDAFAVRVGLKLPAVR